MNFEIGQLIYCNDESIYSHAITKRKSYTVLDIDINKAQVRIKSNTERLVWISFLCFSDVKGPEIISITIDDEIKDSLNDCIEVTIQFSNNQKFYTTFITPEWIKQLLNKQKDYVLGTNLIILKELNKANIESTIYEMDKLNELISMTFEY
ncbi:MAG: hypothetical protein HYZ42_06745 [Bacteroidetes bacterium]|nr:hypothetical protein [Bacteroidota bacterium]